ncbi:hypothetical protein GPN2_21574 [Streptomyces murinus]
MKLSAVGTGDPEVGRFGGRHEDGERAVRESGGAWTVLRPSSFASNSLGWAAAVRVGGRCPTSPVTGPRASSIRTTSRRWPPRRCSTPGTAAGRTR